MGESEEEVAVQRLDLRPVTRFWCPPPALGALPRRGSPHSAPPLPLTDHCATFPFLSSAPNLLAPSLFVQCVGAHKQATTMFQRVPQHSQTSSLGQAMQRAKKASKAAPAKAGEEAPRERRGQPVDKGRLRREQTKSEQAAKAAADTKAMGKGKGKGKGKSVSSHGNTHAEVCKGRPRREQAFNTFPEKAAKAATDTPAQRKAQKREAQEQRSARDSRAAAEAKTAVAERQKAHVKLHSEAKALIAARIAAAEQQRKAAAASLAMEKALFGTKFDLIVAPSVTQIEARLKVHSKKLSDRKRELKDVKEELNDGQTLPLASRRDLEDTTASVVGLCFRTKRIGIQTQTNERMMVLIDRLTPHD